jgi:glycosyltransferase involved in cell wall biosynthesis
MSYHANVSMTVRFVKEIFPRILAGRPDATLWIVGQDPPRAIRRLAREPAITVTGTVDDVRPYLQRAALAVAPLTYGVGIQNKVLEAMACRTPVVASPQAVAALKVRSGVEVVIAADENDTAQAVLSLLNDPDRRSAIGHAGRQYVERRHRWSDAVEEVEEIYCELVRARS